jgi:DNA mismatch repair protein MutS
VAEMAGLPKSIIERSKSLLKDFEKSHHQNQNDQQLSLFEIRDTGSKSQLEEHLKNLDLNHLTPLQALLKLSELKDQLH